jgi:putative membrane protein
MRLVVSWLITAVAIAAAIWIVPGIELYSANVYLSVGILAAVLALLNAIIRPILQLISLPITVLTLGIFALVVNTAVLYLAAWLGNSLFGVNLYIEGFGSAFLASIIISIVTVILGSITGVRDKR